MDPHPLNWLYITWNTMEELSVFLVYPQVLYAVNENVGFVGHATTFELAETEVTEEHWSRRNGT